MKRGLKYLSFIIVLAANIVGIIVSGQVIKGKLTDDQGNPLAGAAISVENSYLGTYSGAEGNWLLKVPHDGMYTLKFSFIGYASVFRNIDLRGTYTVDVTLTAGDIITGEVIVNGIRAGNKTPVTYTNIGQALISGQNNGQDIPYIIGLTPSLIETSEAGTGIGYTGLRIRGTDGSRINVTIDGIPLNDAESQQVFWVDLPDLASSVDNIQIQRGVGTSSNGAGAFGASVNIVTRSSEDLPFAQISTTMGSYGTFKNTITAGTGLLAEKFAFQVRLSDLKSEGYVDRTSSSNRSAYISGIFKTERQRLKANLILGEEHTGISWWGVPAEMLAVNRKYNPAGEYTDENGLSQYYDNESDNYKQDHFQLIYSLSINKFLFFHSAFHYTRGNGYYEEYREDQLLSDYGLSPIIEADSIISITDLIRQKWMSNDFYGIIYSLNYKKERIDAVFGGGLNTYKGDHYGKIIWMRNAGKTEKGYQWYFNHATKREMSIYAKINYKFSESLNGFGDLNYRYIDYEMGGQDDDLKSLDQRHNFSFLNPKVGLYYTISENQNAYYSFAVAHREPTRSDFKEASGDDNSTPLPEALFDHEAGYNLRSEKASIGVNLYGMIYRDQLVPTGELSNVGYPVMTNVKNSYRAGIEFTGALRPVKLIDLQFNITLSRNRIKNFTEYYSDYITADDSYQYKSKDLGNVDIAYSPSLIASGDLALIFSEKLNIHFTAKYVGVQYFDNTMSPERMMEPYLVNNVRMEYKPEIQKVKNTGIQLFINNIFNNKYENNAYGGNWYEDGTENTWAYYFPQAGINFLIKLSIGF